MIRSPIRESSCRRRRLTTSRSSSSSSSSGAAARPGSGRRSANSTATSDRTADAVVIGGGALGAATAFHLRRLGVADVVLVERDALASGSTSKAAGGIRTQFADELNIRIALRALEEFEAMDESISFRQDGYLFLLDREEDLSSFRDALALQHSLGV